MTRNVQTRARMFWTSFFPLVLSLAFVLSFSPLLTLAQTLDSDERFKLLDRNADGKLERHEVVNLMELLNLSDEGSHAFFTAVLEHADSNGDGAIQLDELRAWDAAVIQSLGEVSAGGDGLITHEEICQHLKDYFDMQLSPEDCMQFVVNRDVTKDGLLTPGELFPGSLSTQADKLWIPDDHGRIPVALHWSIVAALSAISVLGV